jgi:hypothetical protein
LYVILLFPCSLVFTSIDIGAQLRQSVGRSVHFERAGCCLHYTGFPIDQELELEEEGCNTRSCRLETHSPFFYVGASDRRTRHFSIYDTNERTE